MMRRHDSIYDTRGQGSTGPNNGRIAKTGTPKGTPPTQGRTTPLAIMWATPRRRIRKVSLPGKRTETREGENKNPKARRQTKDSPQPGPAATAEAKYKHPPPANDGQPEPGRGRSKSARQQR